MHPNRIIRGAALVLLLPLSACWWKRQKAPDVQLSNAELYANAMSELGRKKWDRAIAGFERLTLNLPARDTLLPLAHFRLGQAHEGKREYVLAAESFTRVTESFPDDTLADDALLAAGQAYRKLWRKPAHDSEHGLTAITTYRTLLSMYPNSPLREEANRRIAEIELMFATKDYETGMHYLRRKAFDSAIIYFRDVVRLYPQTARARDAYLRLVEAYRAIRYRDDAEETCATLREKYPNDAEVREECGAGPAAAAAPTP